MNLTDKIEILITKWLINRLRKGYGAECGTSDLDDFEDEFKQMKLSEAIKADRRCAFCRAKETIEWLEKHIDLLKD